MKYIKFLRQQRQFNKAIKRHFKGKVYKIGISEDQFYMLKFLLYNGISNTDELKNILVIPGFEDLENG